jgi:hypothetical protein
MNKKRVLSIGLSVLLCASLAMPSFAAEGFASSVEEMVANPPMSARPYARWWLAEGSHTDETLRESVKELYDAGFGGVEFVTLTSEAEILDVTAYFDGEGNTIRYRVSRAPAGDDALVWEAEADGTITYLSCVQDGSRWSLDDLTDVYSQQRYRSFRGKIQFWYQDLITDDQPPDGGVRLYALSRTVDEAYAGYIQIAAADPLFRWTELGQLEFNPDAADLLGNPVRYDAFAPDLFPCERLKIGK